MSSKKSGGKRGKSLAVVIVIIILLILAYYFLGSQSSPITHPSIYVSGTVITNPFTAPESIIFSGVAGTYTAAVGQDGSYSLNLPGGNSYTVTVIYSAVISTGSNSCSAGTVFIATTPSAYSYNPSC